MDFMEFLGKKIHGFFFRPIFESMANTSPIEPGLVLAMDFFFIHGSVERTLTELNKIDEDFNRNRINYTSLEYSLLFVIIVCGVCTVTPCTLRTF